jgi:hypothetical protein
MKKIYVFLAVFFTAIGISWGLTDIATDAVPSSFRSTAINRINALNTAVEALQDILLASNYTGEGLFGKRIARVEYDVTGGDSGGVGAHGLGVTLPASAIITRSFFFVKTQFVDGGAGTVALHCEDANNIYSAADITGNAAGALVEGVSTGSSGNMKIVDAACEITATVATAAQTAGKLVGFIEYVVAD